VRSEFYLAYGVLQATYPNENSKECHTIAQVKPREEKQLELESYQSKELL
jgi:hypothetical protein